MGEQHTLERFRKDIWYPSLFTRDRFDNWQAQGSQDVMQRARKRLKELLA